jgi:hypothetical protein
MTGKRKSKIDERREKKGDEKKKKAKQRTARFKK